MGRKRSTARLLAAALTIAAAIWVGGTTPAAAQDEVPSAEPPDPTSWYTPIVPARLLDTRSDAVTVDGLGRPGQRLGERRSLDLEVVGRGGIPATHVSAVVLNVTAVSPDQPSFITVWPTGQARPQASNLNFVAGQVVPNPVIAKVGTAGNVSIYNHAGATDVVVDVTGYFPDQDSFVPLLPARLLETRPGLPTYDGVGQFSQPLGPNAALSLDVTGRAGVPNTGVDSVVLNITAVNPTDSSFLTVWPTGSDRPLSSNLNFTRGETVPNLVMAKVGTNGEVSIYNLAGNVDVVADIEGYFPTDSSFVGLHPQRLLDTRTHQPSDVFKSSGPLIGRIASPLTVVGNAGVPAERVSAVVLNITALNARADTFLTVWPSGSERPTTSNLNVKAGQAPRANLVVAKLGFAGRLNLYIHAGRLDVVVDVMGYFLEEPSEVRSLSTSRTSTCMLDWLGRVSCWGSVPVELDSTLSAMVSAELRPRRFPSIGDAIDVAVNAMGTICIVRVDGTVWCWGGTGLLQDAPTHTSWPPFRVEGLTNVVDVEISNHQACAVDTFGGVWCWGTRFDDVRIAVPTRVQGLESTMQVSVGDYVTCALQNSGMVACWGGQAVFGVLGDGSLENSLTPVWVAGLTDADSIWSNDWRACATRASGAAVCWGSQYLGNDSVATAPTPVEVIDGNTGEPADDVWQIGGGYGYGCAVRFDDNLYCWGAAQAGSLGLTPDPTTETWTPTLPVAGLPAVDVIATGPENICALTFESAVYCWGRNTDGQVGNGTIVDQPTPTLVYDPFA